jgi:hypothetical protein
MVSGFRFQVSAQPLAKKKRPVKSKKKSEKSNIERRRVKGEIAALYLSI